MAVLETFLAEPPPLRRDDTGTVRVGGTRVTLETVVGAWRNGSTAEQIVEAYDSLSRADVHAVISYALRHQAEVEEYLAQQEQKSAQARAESKRRSPPDALRARFGRATG